MKYLKTYEGLNKWAPFYNKLTNLFKIIGYRGFHMPRFDSSYNLDLNLIAIPGSISYCIIQKRMQEYNDPDIINIYEDPKNSCFPRDENERGNDKMSFNINDSEPSESYTKIITDVIEKLKTLVKIRVSGGLNTYIPEIIELQIMVLNNNLDYNKELTIPKEVCDKLLINIQGYTKPHKLISDMQKNVPLLYSEIKNIFGKNQIQNSIDMHSMGYSD